MSNFKRIKIKICLLGDPAVGKTSLIQKYIYNFFGDTYMRTLGTKVSRKVVQFHEPVNDIDYEITMMIWDIMGQKFSSVPLDKYLKMSQGALIVCDMTRSETFSSLTEWKNTLQKEAGQVPVVFLANKYDLEKDFEISLSEFDKYSTKENVEHFFTSAKTGENVDNAFLKLGELIVSSIFKLPSKPAVDEIPTPEPKISAEVEPGLKQGAPTPKPQPVMAAVNSQPNINTQKRTAFPNDPDLNRTKQVEKIEIRSGVGYIIRGDNANQSFRIFKELLNQGIQGLCITRTHPNRIKEEFGLKDIPIYWLSAEAPHKENVVAPTFLPQLNTIIRDFIQKNNDVVILLEGIEYLIDQNDFKAVLSLIHSMNDHIMGSKARLLLPIDPLILKERELHILGRDFKFI